MCQSFFFWMLICRSRIKTFQDWIIIQVLISGCARIISNLLVDVSESLFFFVKRNKLCGSRMKVLENYSHEVPISGCVRITSNLLVDVQKSHSSKVEHLSRTKCVNKVQYLLSRGEREKERKKEFLLPNMPLCPVPSYRVHTVCWNGKGESLFKRPSSPLKSERLSTHEFLQMIKM